MTDSRPNRRLLNADSKDDILLVHTPFTGGFGIGRIVHIEPAGPYANTRATAHGEEILDEVDWGNIRVVSWIGTKRKARDPQVGQFVLFDELHAAPFWYAKALADELHKEIDREFRKMQQQNPSQDLEL